MVSINKSFIYGICFASLTWIISLYLYLQFMQTNNEMKNLSTSLPYADLFIKHNLIEDDNNVDIGKVHNFKMASLEKMKEFKEYINDISNKKYTKQSPNDLSSEIGMVRTKQDKKIKDEGYKLYAYNILISKRLSLHRNIPDTRNKLCKNITYPINLPSTSVVICFYNEHFETLLRSVHSIIDRTPKYLKEIILVNDFSDIEHLHDNLKSYIDKTFKSNVKLYKTEKREGLIRARMFGARQAKGDVLVFLDSHIEVNVDWLPPLLARISENKSNIAIPIIDLINPDTFAYSSSPLVRGGFNWGLHFKWENLPTGTLSKSDDFIKPIKSPTMAGGLFAVDRNYFVEIGEYDAGMNIWGGENIEMSFRVWMCGGKLELIPCSRIGHIFRHRRPYGSPDGQDTMLYNSLRVAHVWMDKYKDYFLHEKPEAKTLDYGYIDSRKQLRKELHCKNFEWYLQNVYPELTLPTDDNEKAKEKMAALQQDAFQPWHSRKRNYIKQYQIRLTNSSLCMQSTKDLKSKGSELVLKSCVRARHQVWFETDKKELVLAQLLCLQADKNKVILYKCHEMGADQEWQHKGENKTPIYNVAAGMCIGVDNPQHGTKIIMDLCTDLKYGTWDLIV
nr:polypeptide N-acetylgalactosaminyltransferase 35A-like [Onthophagus taurus]